MPDETKPEAQDSPAAAAPASETPAKKETGEVYMYPGDGETPGVSVRANSPEEAYKLYKAKQREQR